jgi:hypothetical protein
MQKIDLSAFLAFQRNLKSGLKHFIFLEFLCFHSFYKKRTEAVGELNFTYKKINTKN